MIITFILDPFIFFLIFDLLIFHLWLNYKKISTYDYIINERKIIEEKKKKVKIIKNKLEFFKIKKKFILKKKKRKIILKMVKNAKLREI